MSLIRVLPLAAHLLTGSNKARVGAPRRPPRADTTAGASSSRTGTTSCLPGRLHQSSALLTALHRPMVGNSNGGGWEGALRTEGERDQSDPQVALPLQRQWGWVMASDGHSPSFYTQRHRKMEKGIKVIQSQGTALKQNFAVGAAHKLKCS